MAASKRTALTPFWGNDSIHCDTTCSAEDTFYIGYDDDDYEYPAIRERRLALAGQRFLDGSVPFILTSTLKGPFNKSSGWKNPWAKQRSHQNTSPIDHSVDPVPKVPTKKYTRNNKGKRVAKKRQEVTECYLPSPESLKQESVAETAHPFLDDDELEAVCSWRDNVAASPVYVDDPLANKDVRSRNWLKTNVRKRKFDEYSSRPRSLNSSRRHQFSDNIAANTSSTVPPLKTLSSAPAQLSAAERFYRSPTSSSTKGPHSSSQIKEQPTSRKAHRPTSESEDELSQDQQAATLSSPVSLKLHKTTLIKQNSLPLKNQVKLNSSKNKRKSTPPVLDVRSIKPTNLTPAEQLQKDVNRTEEDQGNDDAEEIPHRNDSPSQKPEKINDSIAEDDVSMGENSDKDHGEESADDIEFNAPCQAEQATISDEQLHPSTLQHMDDEASVAPETAHVAEISARMIVDRPSPDDTAQEASEASDGEQAMLSDGTSDELSEVASDDIPSSVGREIAEQLRSDATFYHEDDTQSVNTSIGGVDVDEGTSEAYILGSPEEVMNNVKKAGSPQSTIPANLPHIGIDGAVQMNAFAIDLKENGAKEESLSSNSDIGPCDTSLTRASNQPASEAALGEPEERNILGTEQVPDTEDVLEIEEESVAREPVDVSPEQDADPGPAAASTPEVEIADGEDIAVTPVHTAPQQRQSEFSLRNVIQRLVPSSPWARLSQVASLALAMPLDIALREESSGGINEHAEASNPETQIIVDASSEVQGLSQAVAGDSITDAAITTGINQDSVQMSVEDEVATGVDLHCSLDCPTAERRSTAAKDSVHTPIMVDADTCNKETEPRVKAAPENETNVLQSVEDAAPLHISNPPCDTSDDDLPTPQTVLEAAASSNPVDNALPLTESKYSCVQPLADDPFARSTPEPKFNFTAFSSFASPIRTRPAKQQLYNSKRGGKRGILRRHSNKSGQEKTVSWSRDLERTTDYQMEVGRGLRERSPPPAAALSELPTANNEKFNKHFSAVVKRTDGLRHKFRSYTNGQRTRVAGDDEQEDSLENFPTSSALQGPRSARKYQPEAHEREVSEEPMDVVEDLFAEMGDLLQAFDVDNELVQARKESAAQQSAV